MTIQKYYRELSAKIDRVFETHPQLTDHRVKYPAHIGALGDPFSGIWFVGMYPSQTRVESRPEQPDLSASGEAQWSVSLGDQLLRTMLVKHHFKGGTVESPGEWNCYLTNVIKELIYAGDWGKKTPEERNHIAETWYPVLQWELDNSKPRLVVAMGREAQRLLQRLKVNHRINLPRTEDIENYVYIASRPRGSQPPMDPQRVQEYDDKFARIAGILRQLA